MKFSKKIDMGSFGTAEIILILIIGFIILGPKGLSKLIKTIGKIFGEFSGIKEEVQKSMYEVKNSVNEVIKPVNNKSFKKSNIKKIEDKINKTKKGEK